jgi:DNA-directed RNA polymerase alpha subunit
MAKRIQALLKMDETWYNIFNIQKDEEPAMPYISKNDDISALPLSGRTHNCLRRANIHTIGAMMDYPEEEFINISKMGAKSVEEIKAWIHGLIDGTGEYVLIEAGEYARADAPITQCDDIITNVTAIVLDENSAVVQDIFVKDLDVSVRAKNSLLLNGYKSVSQLMGITFEELMTFQNMGRKTAEEVLD